MGDKRCQKCGKELNELTGGYPAEYPMSYLCRRCYATWKSQIQSDFRKPERDAFEPKCNMAMTPLDLLEQKYESLQQQVNELKKQIEEGFRVNSELFGKGNNIPSPPPPPPIRKAADSL